MQKMYKLTAERLDTLQQELTYLRTVREKEVAEQIKEARSFGDLSENSEYDEAKNEQGRLYSRIAEVENILANAVVIEVEQLACDQVVTGCRVLVQDITTGEKEEYTLVGSQEANPMQNRISDESLFGAALMGRHKDDEITVEAPLGKLHYRILDIHTN